MQRMSWIFITMIICVTSQIILGQQKQFMWDGLMRTYVVYEPPMLEPNPNGHPLVIGLHGTSSNGVGFMATASLVQKANKEKFLVACPDGLNFGLFTYFNAGDGYEELTNGTDDIGFISALIDTMIADYQVDTTRVYVMGFSNGSMMSYRVAAELSHKIAAIGAVSGPLLLESCNPEYPVPIIHFHGLSDPLVPYEGRGDSILVYPPVDTCLAIWREINGCSSIPDTIFQEGEIVGQKWASSSRKSDIELYTIESCVHEWPRPANYGISATDVIWDFLKVQNKIVATNVEVDTHSMPMNFKLYQNCPNPFNPSTRIKYKLAKSSHIVLKIYNLSGQELTTLVNEFQAAGGYEITWQPEGLPSGLYFCKMQSGDFSKTRKVIYQK